MGEARNKLKVTVFQLNHENVTPEVEGRGLVEHYRIDDLFKELGIAGPGEDEKYARLIRQHLGVSLDDKVRTIVNNRSQLQDYMSTKFEKLLPIAAKEISLTETKLRERISGPELTDEVEVNSECIILPDGKFSIVVHQPLTNFCWKMSKLWATRFGEESKVPFEDTAKLAVKLMTAFWAGRINKVEVIPVLDLHREQAHFAGALTSGAEDFVLAHELGHALVDLAPERFSSRIRLSVSASRALISVIETNKPGFPKDKTIAGLRKDELAERWGAEFVTDAVGGSLALAIPKDDPEAPLRTYCAIESILVMFDMLESFYKRVRSGAYPLSAHPPAALRLQMIRQVLRKDEWSYAFTFGASLEEIARDIFQTLGLGCPEYDFLSRLRIQITSK